MQVPPSGNRATRVLEALVASAFLDRKEELFLVGGSVRDRILGEDSPDLDFATSAHPPTTVEILHGLDIGKPYRVGEKYGTIGIRVGDHQIEITTYRSSETYAHGSRKPVVSFGSSLIEDLRRRDFTINAMAMDSVTGEILDPLNGREDLSARLIRAVGSPEARLAEDPLRLLRAIRFAARLNFTIEPATWEAIAKSGSEIERISRERVRDEFTGMLTGPRPSLSLALLRDAGLLRHTVPELLELTQMEDHGPRHPLSLWDHTMRVVEAVPAELVIRWAALLHDVAKPETRTLEPDGRPRFFHHEVVGATLARQVLTGLRYPNQVVDQVSDLIETHMQLHAYSPEWSDGAVRRLTLRLGPLLGSALSLARADGAGHSFDGSSASSPKLDRLEQRTLHLTDDSASRPTSPLSGDDLMTRYGRPPGPWIGEIKSVLENEVIDGRLAPGDREGAWTIADRVAQSRTG